MLAPKAFLDALSGHASRLFNGETPVPRSEFETQFKALLQSGFSKLDLVSREEFDSQMAVLARTRARLEALEAKMAELEGKLGGAEKAESERLDKGSLTALTGDSYQPQWARHLTCSRICAPFSVSALRRS